MVEKNRSYYVDRSPSPYPSCALHLRKPLESSEKQK